MRTCVVGVTALTPSSTSIELICYGPPQWAWSGSRELFKLWKISDNISETVQDRDMVANGSLIANRMWPIEWHH